MHALSCADAPWGGGHAPVTTAARLLRVCAADCSLLPLSKGGGGVRTTLRRAGLFMISCRRPGRRGTRRVLPRAVVRMRDDARRRADRTLRRQRAILFVRRAVGVTQACVKSTSAASICLWLAFRVVRGLEGREHMRAARFPRVRLSTQSGRGSTHMSTRSLIPLTSASARAAAAAVAFCVPGC